MQVIRDGSRGDFDLEDFLRRPLFAHLATGSDFGPRESPVWFIWEDEALWIIGTETGTFPERVRKDPRCAIGIVDFNPETGLVQHAGFRGRARLEPFDKARARRLFTRYLGRAEEQWHSVFLEALEDPNLLFVRFEPETVVVRDQSY